MDNKKTTSQQDNFDVMSKKGTCIEFFSAYQDMDLDRMLNLCDPNGTIAFKPLGPAYQGMIHEIGKALWGALMDAFPDLDNTVKEQTWNEQEQSVSCVVDIFGRQAKEFAGIPNKENDFDSEHIFIFKFNEGDKITDMTINWDHDGFVKQLTR